MNNSPCGSASPFKGRHVDSSIIILCVRWYITYKLSYRDLRDMMAERGIDLAHKIKKEHCDTSTVEQMGVRAQQLWQAVLPV